MSSIGIHLNIKTIDTNMWRSLINASPTSSFFQTPECYDFYESLSFLKPFVFAVSEDDRLCGLVCGYIIADGGRLKRFFSRRAIVPSGLLCREDISEKALRELLSCLKRELRREVIYIEIRNHIDYGRYKPVFRSVGFDYQPHLNYQLDLVSKQVAFESFSKSKRRQIRQATKAGVYWTEAREREEIEQFYAILSRLYSVRVKRPLFPLEFFVKLAALPGGKLLLVKQEGTIIGGMACAVWGDRTLYEWFVCGDETVEKKYYPSVMATWAGIEYALQNNIKKFDFMGAGKPNENYGVREFKSKFGGELEENGRFQYISKRAEYKLGGFYMHKIGNRK